MGIIASKKAFEMEFHWIFVLIAGAVIIGFFFMIAQKQQTASHEKLGVEIATQLDAAFASALQSQGTTQPMPLPSEGIKFYAGDTNAPCGVPPSCDCNYYVFDRPTKFEDKIMFAPNELAATQAIVWTLDFKAPFRATNFFYMTTTKTKYVIVASETDPAVRQMKDKLVKDMPEQIEKQVIAPAQVKDILYNYASTRIIFLNENPADYLQLIISASKEKDVSILNLRLNGEAEFYNKKSNKNTFESVKTVYLADLTNADAAISDAVLYSAIFSENPHLYECQLKQAYQKLNNVAKIIRKRAEQITEKIKTDKPQCAYPTQTLKELEDSAQKAAEEPARAGAILTIAQQLQEQYKTLLISNCPGLY